MPTAKILDLSNKEVGEIELPEVVFDVPVNEPLIHEAVRSFLAGTQALEAEGYRPRAHCEFAFAALERRR